MKTLTKINFELFYYLFTYVLKTNTSQRPISRLKRANLSKKEMFLIQQSKVANIKCHCWEIVGLICECQTRPTSKNLRRNVANDLLVVRNNLLAARQCIGQWPCFNTTDGMVDMGTISLYHRLSKVSLRMYQVRWGGQLNFIFQIQIYIWPLQRMADSKCHRLHGIEWFQRCWLWVCYHRWLLVGKRTWSGH